MQDFITNSDWFIINEITTDIYTSVPYPDLPSIIVKLKKLIYFSHSINCLISDVDKSVEFFSYQSDDIPIEHIELYRSKYVYYDFILWYCAVPKELTFRESEIIVEKYMAESLFMKEWMEPINAYYGAVANISANNYSYANICLYRSKEEGDFSDRDMAILKIINHHLSLRFSSVFPNGIKRYHFEKHLELYASVYHLSNREMELVKLVSAGVHRNELSEKLFISESTVKKHLNKIYTKLNVKNFDEFVRKLNPGVKYITE